MRAGRHALSLALASVVASCAAERTLTITSDPPGALVRLDDTIVGTTPYSQRFNDYGTRRITLYREGYRIQSELVTIEGPWYAQFPFDLFSEVLFPFGWKDPHSKHMVLEPESGIVTAPDLKAVLDRAEALRLAEPSGPRPVIHPPAPIAKPAIEVKPATEPKPEPH